MSTATPVPEAYDLDGDDARKTLEHVSPKALVRDSVQRMRFSDGFGHARATAFQVVLTLIPGMIVLVAVAARLQWESLSTALVRSIESLAPGPASDVFQEAFERGDRAGATSLGALWLAVAITAIFKASPRRRQPTWSWLASGTLLAFAAQLEAARAGLCETRSVDKIEAGEPDAAVMSYGAALGRSQ